MDRLDIIVDLQYGSTGKGLLAGYLATTFEPDTVVTAWAPNAGHTFIDKNGRKFVHTHLANGVVSPNLRRILLGPGSVINPAQFLAEVHACTDLLQATGARIMIHPHAAVVTEEHVQEEAGPMTKIGSTKKGVGAAMIQRIRRDPDNMNIAGFCDELAEYVVSKGEYYDALQAARIVMIEGAQGYGLSMYHGFYPYTTSRDVSVWQVLADCGIPARFVSPGLMAIYGTARTFPIRVANRFDENGKQVGFSGPHYPDQEEITFESIGQATELTTVTKLPRRIFTFSRQQILEAATHCGADQVFLNFVNYCRTPAELMDIVDKIESNGFSRVRWVGTGPTVKDVHMVDSYNSSSMRRNAILKVWEKTHA